MTDHLDEGTLQALLDGELPPGDAKTAEEHLKACRLCEAELAALRDGSLVFASAVSRLDVPPGSARSRMLPPPSVRRPTRWIALALPRVAAVLLVSVAAVAAAMPGSPIRSWIDRELASSAPATTSPTDDAPVVTEPDPSPRSGVSVEPARGHLRIVLIRPAADLRVRATITDSPRGGAYTVGTTTTARFATGVGLVEVIEASGGELFLEIPAGATTATVEVDGKPYLVKEGGQLRLLVASDETVGAEVLFQAR